MKLLRRALALSPLLPFLASVTLLGCDTSRGGADLDRLTDEVLSRVSAVGSKQGEVASEELAKLFTYEYKLVELAIDERPAVLEATLQRLGQDRWDCFHIESASPRLLVFCKRQPKSILRYVPRVF